MKKFLSIFLTVMLVAAVMTVSALAAGIGIDDKGIYYTDLLDFTQETNDLWAQYNEETGRWECKYKWGDWEQPTDDDLNPIAPILRSYSSFSAHRWSLIEGGEVFRFESTDSSIYPGISFCIDEMQEGVMQIGRETGNPAKAEYVKVRIRNHSVCDQMTFAFVLKNTNNGNFVNATISELTVDADGKKYESSGEWTTYTFSMYEINMNTNYEEFLYDPTDENDTPTSRWGGQLFELLIFPFGYDVTDGSGNYPGAAMDIDYIVIGSRAYVDSYQSALEEKEGNIASLELIQAPTKKDYYVGEALDLTGLELKATYKDGTTETLNTASADVSTFDEVVSNVTLKFGKETASFPVNITDITGIEVNAQPEDTVFQVTELADGFVSDGYQIKVSYADGTSKISDVSPNAENGALLSNSSFKFVGNFTEAGVQTVTVYYFGRSTTFDITTIQVNDLEITPNVIYRYNSVPAIGDFTINYIYTDGTTVAADDSLEFEYTVACAVKTPGTVTATITATETTYGITIEKNVEVTVETPTGVQVTSMPTKTEYNRGEKFDATGMVLSLVYEDGSVVDLNSEDYTASAITSSSGTKYVSFETEIEGLDVIFEDAELDVSITVAGGSTTASGSSDGESTSKNTTASTTNKTNNNKGDSNNGLILPIIIVAAVLVVGAVVVVVLVVVKKKKN